MFDILLDSQLQGAGHERLLPDEAHRFCPHSAEGSTTMSWTQGRLSATVGRRPDGLPMLDRGAHRSPEQGACLMEYVSVLAGTRFSDHPKCTHPALAQLARVVNDEVVDPAARSRLAVLAPDLIGTRCRDPRITLTVMACCLRAAVAARPQGRDLPLALERIDAQLDRLAAQRSRRWARLRTVGSEPGVLAVISTLRVVLRHTHRFRGPRHDDQLCELLERAVADCRELLVQRPARPTRQQSQPAVR